MKVGDLVVRNNHFDLMGTGVILDSHENEDGVVYFEVQWFEDERLWYDTLELKVISESR